MTTQPTSDQEEPTSAEGTGAETAPTGDNETVVAPGGSEAAPTTLEGGSEAGGEPEGQPAIPHGPTGAELLDLLKGDTEAQGLIRQQLADGLAQAQEQVLSKARQDQLQNLIKDERYDEIGRMFVEEQQSEAVRSVAEEAALRQVYGDIYRRVFSHPVMKSLNEGERNLLNPSNFQDDASYVLALTAFIATKSDEQQRGTLVDAKVNEKLQTLQNMAAANAVTNPSVSGLPGAVAAGGGNKTASELIAEGWADQLAEARES